MRYQFSAKIFVRIATYGLLLAPCVGATNILFPWSLPRMVWMVALYGILIVAAVALLMRGVTVKVTLIDVAVSLFMVMLVITSMTGMDVQKSLWSDPSRTIGVVFWLLWYGGYVAWRVTAGDDSEWNKIWIVSAVVLVLISALGVVQAYVPIFSDQEAGARSTGFFGNALIFGNYAAIFAFVPWLARGRAALRTRVEYLGASAVSALACVALFFTQTRGAFVGIIAGVMMTGGIILWGKYFHHARDPRAIRASSRKNLIIGVSIVVLVCGGVFIGARSPVAKNFFENNLNFNRSQTIQTRLINWRLALHAIAARPLRGWGWENYHFAVDQFFDPAFGKFSLYETRIDKPHSVPLEIAVTTGVVGLIAYLFIFYALARTMIRGVRRGSISYTTAALVAGAITTYFVENLSSFDTQSSLLFFGLVLAYSARMADDTPVIVWHIAPRPVFGRTLTAVCAVVIGLLFWYGAYIPLVTGYYISDALTGLDMHDMARVDTAFTHAYALPAGPYAFETWRWMGFALMSDYTFGQGKISDIPSDVRVRWFADINKIGGLTRQYFVAHQNDAVWQSFVSRVSYQVGLATGDQSFFTMGEQAAHREMALAPARQESYLMLTQFALARHNEIAAMQDLFDAFTLGDFPESTPFINQLSQKFAAKQDYADLVRLYEFVVQHKDDINGPSGAQWYAQLAAAYAAMGRIADAQQAVASAVARDPSFASDAQKFLQQLNAHPKK